MPFFALLLLLLCTSSCRGLQSVREALYSEYDDNEDGDYIDDYYYSDYGDQRRPVPKRNEEQNEHERRPLRLQRGDSYAGRGEQASSE